MNEFAEYKIYTTGYIGLRIVDDIMLGMKSRHGFIIVRILPDVVHVLSDQTKIFLGDDRIYNAKKYLDIIDAERIR
jgi:hypothetical protein